MFGINWQRRTVKTLLTLFMVGMITLSTLGCSGQNQLPELNLNKSASPVQGRKIAEVSPPAPLQALRQAMEVYQPQVSILSPRPNEVLTDNTVEVQLQVEDLPIFQDAQWKLGPHLHVILDNQPYQAVYNLDQPVVFSDLEPGTHTLRVFPVRPWHESFKNEGAYAQTTFHIFTPTADQQPDPELPLLTYSRPKGEYGAEPIMLDFYLTNAPLHLVAQENPEDEVTDWRIRVTVNGDSFVIDQWQPLYLKGFKPGKNWVKLEFLDDQGNPIENEFNTTARLVTFNPKGQDTLAKLVRGELKASELRGIVDPEYAATTPAPVPVVMPTPVPEVEVPVVEPVKVEEPVVIEEPTPEVPLTPAPETPAETINLEETTVPEVEPPPTIPEETAEPEPVVSEKTPETVPVTEETTAEISNPESVDIVPTLETETTEEVPVEPAGMEVGTPESGVVESSERVDISVPGTQPTPAATSSSEPFNLGKFFDGLLNQIKELVNVNGNQPSAPTQPVVQEKVISVPGASPMEVEPTVVPISEPVETVIEETQPEIIETQEITTSETKTTSEILTVTETQETQTETETPAVEDVEIEAPTS